MFCYIPELPQLGPIVVKILQTNASLRTIARMTDKYIKHVVLLTSSGAQVTWTDFSYSFLGIKLTCDIRAGEEAIVCHHLARE